MTEAATNLPTVRTTGLQLHEGQTVLGERQVHIQTSGKIRPGIMRLTRAGAEDPRAVAAYEAGVAAGKSFEEVARDVKAALGLGDGQRAPMTPQNTPYFTCRRGDFTSPEIADRIMEQYAEDRGDGPHLYRFPVVFPVDSWQAVLPHELAAYTQRERRYWSEYHDGVRYCMQKAPLQKDEHAKRYKRTFGGRPSVLRDWNGGRCDPDQCPEYQAHPQQCRLTGRILFNIHGIPGNPLEMRTNSFYAMQGIRQQLELMMYMRGRIAGLFNGKPGFYLTKRQEEVSMLDLEKGVPTKVKQWITVLETTADLTLLLTAPEDEHDEVPNAIAVLQGPDDDIAEGEFDEPVPTVEDLQKVIAARVAELAFPWRELAPYLDKTYGEWKTDVQKLGQIREVLKNVADAAALAKLTEGAPF